jgi:hypothetical protein
MDQLLPLMWTHSRHVALSALFKEVALSGEFTLLYSTL